MAIRMARIQSYGDISLQKAIFNVAFRCACVAWSIFSSDMASIEPTAAKAN